MARNDKEIDPNVKERDTSEYEKYDRTSLGSVFSHTGLGKLLKGIWSVISTPFIILIDSLRRLAIAVAMPKDIRKAFYEEEKKQIFDSVKQRALESPYVSNKKMEILARNIPDNEKLNELAKLAHKHNSELVIVLKDGSALKFTPEEKDVTIRFSDVPKMRGENNVPTYLFGTPLGNYHFSKEGIVLNGHVKDININTVLDRIKERGGINIKVDSLKEGTQIETLSSFVSPEKAVYNDKAPKETEKDKEQSINEPEKTIYDKNNLTYEKISIEQPAPEDKIKAQITNTDKRDNDNKGYVFAKDENGTSYMIHINNFDDKKQFNSLEKGGYVDFVPIQNEEGKWSGQKITESSHFNVIKPVLSDEDKENTATFYYSSPTDDGQILFSGLIGSAALIAAMGEPNANIENLEGKIGVFIRNDFPGDGENKTKMFFDTEQEAYLFLKEKDIILDKEECVKLIQKEDLDEYYTKEELFVEEQKDIIQETPESIVSENELDEPEYSDEESDIDKTEEIPETKPIPLDKQVEAIQKEEKHEHKEPSPNTHRSDKDMDIAE